MSGDNLGKEFDDLFKETGESIRVGQWQLVVALLTFVATIASIVQYVPRIIIIGILLTALAFSVISIVRSRERVDAIRYAWYKRITAGEKLRLRISGSSEFMKSELQKLYVSGLRVNYQLALLEGQKELAEYLKRELDGYQEREYQTSRITR